MSVLSHHLAIATIIANLERLGMLTQNHYSNTKHLNTGQEYDALLSSTAFLQVLRLQGVNTKLCSSLLFSSKICVDPALSIFNL
ncbi:hypothetical protein E2C01_076403 [Portunus trituberculatus]|uniref:Uncharacterized protein n=1 Tax=Portunus trituberculatus TaxID=210409 RepID=A0A5B7IBC9_PORTR|nr:hypothetical protein [Portunus trituberculatus]